MARVFVIFTIVSLYSADAVDVGLNQGTGSNYGTYHLLTPAARNSCS
jgi:hypothetical protein